MGRVIFFGNKIFSFVFYLITIRSYMDVYQSIQLLSNSEVLSIRNISSIIVSVCAALYWIPRAWNYLIDLPYKRQEDKNRREILEIQKKREQIEYEMLNEKTEARAALKKIAMSTKVRKYTTNQLLDKVKTLPSFKGFPDKEFIIGVRSNENIKNSYDDKFYHFNADLKCVNVLTGTTQSGSFGYNNWSKWSKKGYAEIRANECYYDVWKGGLHNGKMKALRQIGWFKVIRKKHFEDDTDVWEWERNKGLNFHTNTYKKVQKLITWFIGGWSTGCQVANDMKDYNKSIKTLYRQDSVSYFLLYEFKV